MFKHLHLQMVRYLYTTGSSNWENQNAAATYTNEDAMDAAAGMITSASHSNITVT